LGFALASLAAVALAMAACSPAPAATPTLPAPSATTVPATTVPATPTRLAAPSPTATPTLAPTATPILRATALPDVDSDWLLIVQRSTQRLTLYRRGVEQHSYAVSTGKSDTVTPLGWWKIVEKRPVAPGGIYGTRWLGFQRWNPEAGRYEWYAESSPFGIHGTNEPEKIGSAVSLGCVRLPNRDVEEVYELVPLGAYVLVVD
jgi:lipoprotein-anchoring transpeptidase ErfK/SrfK